MYQSTNMFSGNIEQSFRACLQERDNNIPLGDNYFNPVPDTPEEYFTTPNLRNDENEPSLNILREFYRKYHGIVEKCDECNGRETTSDLYTSNDYFTNVSGAHTKMLMFLNEAISKFKLREVTTKRKIIQRLEAVEWVIGKLNIVKNEDNTEKVLTRIQRLLASKKCADKKKEEAKKIGVSYNQYRSQTSKRKRIRLTEDFAVNDVETNFPDTIVATNNHLANPIIPRRSPVKSKLVFPPQDLSNDDIVAVAEDDGFYVGKIKTDVSKGENKVIRIEQFIQVKHENVYKEPKKSKRKLWDIDSHWIIAVVDWIFYNSKDDSIQITNRDEIDIMYQKRMGLEDNA